MVVDSLRRLVFVHIPKTGGISVTEALGGPSKEYRTHGPASILKDEHSAYTRFAIIRNPLTWYVSSYFYKISGNKGFDQEGSFEDFLEDMLTISERTRRWFKPWPRVDPAAMIEPCLEAGRTDLGFLTINLLYYCFEGFEDIIAGRKALPSLSSDALESLVDEILRIEYLGEEFADMVRRRELDLPERLMVKAPRKNVTPGKPQRDVYSEDAREQVQRKDRLILGGFYPAESPA